MLCTTQGKTKYFFHTNCFLAKTERDGKTSSHYQRKRRSSATPNSYNSQFGGTEAEVTDGTAWLVKVAKFKCICSLRRSHPPLR